MDQENDRLSIISAARASAVRAPTLNNGRCCLRQAANSMASLIRNNGFRMARRDTSRPATLRFSLSNQPPVDGVNDRFNLQ